MSTHNDIQDEMRDLNSSLPPSGGTGSYEVPGGYFEGLPDAILNRIRSTRDTSAREETATLSPLLAGISREMPYAVPTGYFETLTTGLQAITAEDPESDILLLAERQMPYEVPDGYFALLPEQILARVRRGSARVVSMGRPRFMRMAAAAMITGIIALSGYFYFNGKRDVPVTSPEWVAKNVKNVSNKAIEDFVKTTDVTVASKETVQKTAGSTDVKKMLQDVSDKELDAFLSQVPSEEEELFAEFN